MITLVVTSYNRFDLLQKTIDSFRSVTPPMGGIIIDDSCTKGMRRRITENYSDYQLVFNETNIGLIESIDKAYAGVTTPYIFHSEDDFEYTKSGFIEKCIEVMESDPKIFRVGIRGQTHDPSLDSEIKTAGSTAYRLAKFHSLEIEEHKRQFWHGFGFQCGMIRKSSYDLVKPYSQYSEPSEFITVRECKIGTAYYNLGLLAVSLTEDYAKHTGGRRSTYGLRMEG